MSLWGRGGGGEGGAKFSSVAECLFIVRWGRRIDPLEDPLSYFSFQPVVHSRYNKGCGMYYPVCEIVQLKEPLLLIKIISLCSGCSEFPLSLSECSMSEAYNRKIKCVECVVK